MKNKNCKKCGLLSLVKDWFKNWKQRYKCRSCKSVQQNKSRNTFNLENLYHAYQNWKQTYKQLALRYWLSIPTIKKRIESYIPLKKILLQLTQ